MSPPRGPDRYGRAPGDPFYGADYGAEAVRPPDLFGRPWGHPDYGADPPARRAERESPAGEESKLLRELVKRVSSLERASRRSMVFEAGIGNVRLLGGNNGDLPTWDTESTSYVDLGGTNVTAKTVTKVAADTDLLVLWWWDGFRNDANSSGGAGSFTSETGIEVDSTDFGAWQFRWTTNAEHNIVSGFTAIAGIGAGARVLQLRVRNQVAGKSLETNSASHFGWLALEVPASLTFS